MTKYLALLFLLASPVLAAHLIYDERAPINQRAIDEIVKNEKARFYGTPYSWDGEASTDTKTYSDWTVVKGTESYTLKEFVEGGRFCEWRGFHDWNGEAINPDPAWKSCTCKMDGISVYKGFRTDTCKICHRCRRKIKVHKEELEWEP